MADNRMSIYAGPPILAALAGHEDRRSARLNTIAVRYLDIVRRDCPPFTEAEWSAICDALNGYWMGAGGDSGIRLAWAEILDADRLDGLGRKWGADAEALALRLRDATTGQQTAVAEVVERFWARADLPTRQALEAAGARIVEHRSTLCVRCEVIVAPRDDGGDALCPRCGLVL